MNETPLERLGFLKPNNINSEIDSVFVKKAREKYQIPIYTEGSFHEQDKNQKKQEKLTNFPIGSFVYLDFDEKLFDKSYNISVRK